MRVAASPLIRAHYPDLLEIPAEPGFVDLTIIHRHDWKPEYSHRTRQLRYIVVTSISQVHELLEVIGYGPSRSSVST